MKEERQLAQCIEAAKAAHFTPDGKACDYRALGLSPECDALTACLACLSAFDPRKLAIPHQTAFWLNLYNACVLRDAPQLGSKGFFERARAQVCGHSWSLDDIEHGLLRGNVPKYASLRAPMRKGDPRLGFTPLRYDERMHFAMFTACRSSPPLRVFHGEALDAELEEATSAYLRAHTRVESEGAVVVVPRIFQWYAGDFGSVLGFVVARLDDEAAVDAIDRRRGRVSLRYADYDWTLARRAT